MYIYKKRVGTGYRYVFLNTGSELILKKIDYIIDLIKDDFFDEYISGNIKYCVPEDYKNNNLFDLLEDEKKKIEKEMENIY